MEEQRGRTGLQAAAAGAKALRWPSVLCACRQHKEAPPGGPLA